MWYRLTAMHLSDLNIFQLFCSRLEKIYGSKCSGPLLCCLLWKSLTNIQSIQLKLETCYHRIATSYFQCKSISYELNNKTSPMHFLLFQCWKHWHEKQINTCIQKLVLLIYNNCIGFEVLNLRFDLCHINQLPKNLYNFKRVSQRFLFSPKILWWAWKTL